MTFALAMVLAAAAAIRSTWSPCGVSMLSTITPMTESTRGHRFRTTACWYLAGALVGGTMLGGVIALLSAVVAGWDLSAPTQLLIVAAGAVVAVASDGKLFGFQLPGHDRQVNERWLDLYRSWVYGFGFGWQIGFGLSTYIMTAGIYLLIVAGALGGSLGSGFALGAVFGLIRGMAVFMTSDIKNQQSMAEFHRRFEQLRQPVRRGMIGVLAMVGVVAGVASNSVWGIVLALAAAGVTLAVIGSVHETGYRVRQVGESA